MHEIIPQRLWTGNIGDIQDIGKLLDAGIGAVVDLALEESAAKLTREMVYCRFPLLDGSGNSPVTLRVAIETTATLIRSQVPTLVFCGAGMSRSPAIAAAAWAVATRQPLDECLKRLTSSAAHDVSPALWYDIETVFEEIARLG